LNFANRDWIDYSLDSITFNYETAEIKVSEQQTFTICCLDYIAFQNIAHWDENIISEISVSETSDFLLNAISTIKRRYATDYVGGGTKRLNDSFKSLLITLIDGNTVEIVAKDFQIEEQLAIKGQA
jgi:hypothetical protein